MVSHRLSLNSRNISLKNPGFDILCLNPTSPIRDKGLIDKCIVEFSKNDYDAVASGIITKFIEWPTNMKRTQDLEGFFIDNGAVYVYKESLIKQKTLLSKNSGRVFVDKEEYVDIDDEFDFKVAEFILKGMIESQSFYIYVFLDLYGTCFVNNTFSLRIFGFLLYLE